MIISDDFNKMTIAEDFADTYIEFLRSEYDRFTPWLMSIMDVTELRDIIIILYWAISNTWDMINHSPVPNQFWLPFMEYNLRAVIRRVHSDFEDYGTDDYVSAVRLALQRGFQMIVDINAVGPSAGYPF